MTALNWLFGCCDVVVSTIVLLLDVYLLWPVTGPMWLATRMYDWIGPARLARLVRCNLWFKHLALRALLELRPLGLAALPLWLSNYLATTSDSIGLRTWMVICVGCNEWLLWKLGKDDDRWKRRRRKLTSRVMELGGKLVVVPEPVRA